MDNQEPTAGQQNEWVRDALELSGFESTPTDGVYFKSHGDMKLVVDGTSVYFKDGSGRVDDPEDPAIMSVKEIIADAKTGAMPGQQEPDMHYQKEAEQPEEEQTSTTDIIPVLTTTDIVRPAVSASNAIAAWNEFQELQKAILQPSDFQKIGNKDFKKKSAWRKFATFFNLNDKIVEEVQTQHSEGNGWTWKIKVVCHAPNGRSTEGVGMCSTSERNFAHLEHDTYATAHTRAKNRAISDMVAAGEVSAEEMNI